MLPSRKEISAHIAVSPPCSRNGLPNHVLAMLCMSLYVVFVYVQGRFMEYTMRLGHLWRSQVSRWAKGGMAGAVFLSLSARMSHQELSLIRAKASRQFGCLPECHLHC